MTITKTFTQIHVAHDCEARNWVWEDTNNDYATKAKELRIEWNGWFNGVRVVEKTFDDETFTITTKVIKTTMRSYDDDHRWNGAEEKVEEE